MDLKTKSVEPRRGFSANTTASSITPPVPTVTEPTGDGIFEFRASALDQTVANQAELIFFGAGANNATATCQVFLWYSIDGLWIPIRAFGLDLTLSNTVGVAGKSVIDTDRFVDTLAFTSGVTHNSWVDLSSPADDTVGRCIFDIIGAAKVQVLTAKGTATNLNALLRGF